MLGLDMDLMMVSLGGPIEVGRRMLLKTASKLKFGQVVVRGAKNNLRDGKGATRDIKLHMRVKVCPYLIGRSLRLITRILRCCPRALGSD